MADINQNNKISWVALRHAIAKQAGVAEKDALIFLNSLVVQLTKGLKQDKSVKINNLGTFRLVVVAPRKSIDVTTGETIIIPSYNKVTFVPESSIREAMHPAKVEPLLDANDPIKKLNEQADEIIDILADLGQGPKAAAEEEPVSMAPVQEENTVEEVTEMPEASAHVEEVQEEVATQAAEEDVEQPEEITETSKTEEESVETVAIPEAETIQETEVVDEQTAPHEEVTIATEKKSMSVGKTIVLSIVAFCLLLVGLFFFMQHKVETWVETLREKTASQQVETVAKEVSKTDVSQIEIAATVTDTPQIAPVEEMRATDLVYEEFITTEHMHKNSRLAWMAYRFYGNKDLWVFIYDANKDHLSSPNYIKVDTPIRVPKLSKELMDTNHPTTKKIIEELKNKFASIQ